MKEFDTVRTLAEATTLDHVVVPAGTVGVITDVHNNGRGFALEITINGEPDEILVDADQVESVNGTAG